MLHNYPISHWSARELPNQAILGDNSVQASPSQGGVMSIQNGIALFWNVNKLANSSGTFHVQNAADTIGTSSLTVLANQSWPSETPV